MKKFFKEFKTFISRGNIVDLAVGVIIGGAFSSIVTAFTNKIIMPLINWLLAVVGGDGIESVYTFLGNPVYDASGNIDFANSIYIDWSAFITAIINFLLIALTLFIIIKVINTSRKYLGEFSNMSKKENRELYKQLKQKAKAENRKYKEVKAEYEAEIAAKAQAEAEALALQEKLAHPGEEALLIEIRDLLKEQKEAKLSETTKSTAKKAKTK